MERIEDQEGWIDFSKQKPEIGQQIEAQGQDYAVTFPRKAMTGIYIGATSGSRGKIKNLEHRYICFFDKWRPENNNSHFNSVKFDEIAPGSEDCIFDYKIPKPSISPRYYCMTHQSWFCVHKNPIEKLLAPKHQA
jgi:hypothetical protein